MRLGVVIITSDRKFVYLLTNHVFGNMVNIDSVERILFSVYQEDAEVGVFAFHFKDIAVAVDAETSTLRKTIRQF